MPGNMLSENENDILKIIRDLEAFERVEIQADKNGKPDQYIVHRSSKVILDESGKKHTK